MRRHAWLAVPIAAALAAGCGTTLPPQSQNQALSTQGLGAGPGSSSGTTQGGTGSASIASGSSTPSGSSAVVDGGGGGAASSDAGVGSSSTDSTGSTKSTSAATAKATASSSSGSAATQVKTPIQIGFMGASSAAAAVTAIGAHSVSQETPQAAFADFVQRLNKSGGVDGRRVEVVEDFISPTSSNYDVQASAACADFTQDHHVAVVFSVEDNYYSQSFSACLASAGVPEFLAVNGGVSPADLGDYPALFSTTAPTVNRRFAALISGLSANGYFSKQTKIGVIVEDCPFNEAAYTSTIAPALKARGFTFYRRDVACIHGFSDAAGFIVAVQNQVLPLRSAGVSRVMFVTGFEGAAVEFFEKQANLQGYKPGYALTSNADIGDNAEGFNAATLARVQGVGWAPDYDITNLPTGSSASQRCQRIWRGYAPAAARSNRLANDTICEEFFLLEAVLSHTGGNSSAQSVESAMHNLGTSYDSALALGGGTDYSATVKDGPRLFAAFGYKASCHCIAYTSAPKPLA